MVDDETFSRVRSDHKGRRASHVHSKGGNLAARSRIQETGRSESAKARAEAEGLTFRFGPRFRGFRSACFLYSASRRKISAFGMDMRCSTAFVIASYSAECFIVHHIKLFFLLLFLLLCPLPQLPE